ncbi:MAG: hypothetical protein D6704_05250 [Nitrospirae bacterium]|nr:MAG: hypothetical protein D6704_05250 [Nitrospirota bacterium]
MPIVWCAISGHGFGHAAQVVPVLNELGKRIPKLHVVLRTTVPAAFFARRLHVSWELSPSVQDVGCVQQGPLTIDVAATWRAYQQFHATWAQRVAEEVQSLRVWRPRLVLSNISYLALEAGKRAGIPTVALASLAWDEILEGLQSEETEACRHIIQHIRASYQQADLLIRLSPGLPLKAFPHVQTVGPVNRPIHSSSQNHLKNNGRDTPLVLVAFGGVPLSSFPSERVARLRGYHVLLDRSLAEMHAAAWRSPFESQAGAQGFDERFAMADVIVSKPGYATVVEAVAARKPLIYVRRENFAEEPALVEYLHRFGRACELSREEFFSGAWERALHDVTVLPAPTMPPPPSGIPRAVELLISVL